MARGKGRRRSLQWAHQTCGRHECWRGDSVDSTTAFWWSGACHSAVCGLVGHKDEFVQQMPLLCVCVCVTQGRCVGALGGNGKRDDEVRS